MKNKKGFTLIELLAVIVILAIVALIAIPKIISVIEDAQKKAFENTAYGVLDCLKINYTERILTGTAEEEKRFTFPNSGLKIAGEEPSFGSAKIDSKGNISFALADKDKKWCAKKEINSEKVIFEGYTEENCQIGETTDEGGGGTLVPPTGEDTHKGIVYLDPTNLTKECNEENSVSDTGTKTGCMKWYIYDNSGDTYKMILDHNTTSTVAWNSDNVNTEMKEVKIVLEKDTVNWDKSLDAKLITADEIAKVTGNTNFNSLINSGSDWFYFDSKNQIQSATEDNKSNYAWLFDRTYSCIQYGCNIKEDITYGYWTSSNIHNEFTDVWVVIYFGSLYSNFSSDSSFYGVRPVVTLSKSMLQ